VKTLGLICFVLLTQSSAFAQDVQHESNREIRRKCVLATQNVDNLTRNYDEAKLRYNTPAQHPGDIMTIALFNWRISGAKTVMAQYCNGNQ
jgi:hypothetical protein